jgi:hypothetical protein
MGDGYDRESAAAYAAKWAYGRNPAYHNFDDIGGDCTNFISQCLFAGCGVMNFTPVYGWYYIDLNKRTPSWTGVKFLYDFLVNNNGKGPYAAAADKSQVEIADLIQLKRGSYFTHTLIITKIYGGNIYVASHTYDSCDNPLYNYMYDDIRFLHILGARA